MRVTIRSMFNELAKYQSKYYKGKIESFPRTGYVFSDKGWQSPNGRFFKPFESDDGRIVSFTNRPSVCCPSPEIGSEFPKIRSYYRVHKSICNKCPHRIKGGFCELLRIERNQGGNQT